MSKINPTISHSSISMNSVVLTSTDTPQTLSEAIAAALAAGDTTMPAVSAKGAPIVNTSTTSNASVLGDQPATSASVIVSGDSLLIGMYNQVPTVAGVTPTIDTTLSAVAITEVDSGDDIVSNVTGQSAPQVEMTAASTADMQVGAKIAIVGTTNYDKTFYIESISGSTFRVASAFTAETPAGTETVKSPAFGITVAAGEIYQLSSSEDVKNFKFVSAATSTPSTLTVDLKYGG